MGAAQMASNADLFAVNHQRRVSIQVKTTNAQKQHTVALNEDAAGWLNFGYATGYLRDKKPIFNSKDSPLIADVVIAVSFHPQLRSDNVGRFRSVCETRSAHYRFALSRLERNGCVAAAL
jgi:hypothetical protein